MRYLCLLLLATLATLATAALALDYWPDDPDGAIYTYRSADGNETITATFQVVGEFHYFTRTIGDCSVAETYRVTDSSVELTSYGFICLGMPDPDEHWCEPAIPVVTDSTAVGNHYDYSGQINGVETPATVVSVPMTIDVPLGSFDVVRVSYVFHWSAPGIVPPQLWLHSELGPVRVDDWVLVSVEESSPIETHSWSQVKQLFD